MGAGELIIILIIVFFLFGAKRLPEMGKGIGQVIRTISDPQQKSEPWMVHLAAATALFVALWFVLANHFGLLPR